jgi:hypothetical protein
LPDRRRAGGAGLRFQPGDREGSGEAVAPRSQPARRMQPSNSSRRCIPTASPMATRCGSALRPVYVGKLKVQMIAEYRGRS